MVPSELRPLFSPGGEQALAAVLRREPLLAFDFDGTLAPIVARPEQACIAPELSHSLAALARLRPVAIITGRSIADVSQRLSFSPQYIVGSHGAEDPDQARGTDLVALLAPGREVLATHAATLRGLGVEVEDKRHSLALHYRRAPDPEQALRGIEPLLAAMGPGLHIFHGKCVVNIASAQAPDKGDALHAVVRRARAGAAVFLGDDLNDEAAFAKAAPGWLTVRIGREHAGSQALFCLDGQEQVAPLLRRMLALLSG